MTEQKWILLVEDNAQDAELALRTLGAKQPPGSVVLARNGLEALDCLCHRGHFCACHRGNPVLVLLDLKMPKVDGLEALRRIKANEHLKHIPIVVFTSSREERDLKRSYELGANGYVVKPVDFRKFVTALEALKNFWTSINEPPPDNDPKPFPAKEDLRHAA